MNGGAIVGIVVLVGLVISGIIALYPSPDEVFQQIAGNESVVGVPAEQVTIALEASRFTYTPAVVRVKAGQNVTIQITNVDTVHGLRIPALNISGTRDVNFIAPAPGTYDFSCPTMCGSGHRGMQGSLVVE